MRGRRHVELLRRKRRAIECRMINPIRLWQRRQRHIGCCKYRHVTGTFVAAYLCMHTCWYRHVTGMFSSLQITHCFQLFLIYVVGIYGCERMGDATPPSRGAGLLPAIYHHHTLTIPSPLTVLSTVGALIIRVHCSVQPATVIHIFIACHSVYLYSMPQ